jgi:hypothetical protein
MLGGLGFPPAPAPAPRKSRLLPIVVVSVAALLVLCVGGGTAVVIAVRDNAKKFVATADQKSTPTPTATPEESDEPTPAPTTKITLIEPKTLGGRPKLTDRQFAPIVKRLKSMMSGYPDATASVGAIYGSTNRRNLVMAAAVAAPIDDPEQELDNAFLGPGLTGVKINKITDVQPGPLGGEARCGRAVQGELTMSICTWADSGSFGMLVFYFPSIAKAKAEFSKLRGQVEKKSS